MSKIDYEAIRRRWIVEGAESDLGLWWLADDLREALPSASSEEEVRTATLAALRPLLESHALTAVTLSDDGQFEVWPGTVEQVIARIEAGWRDVGVPDIGDVVWFFGERSTLRS